MTAVAFVVVFAVVVAVAFLVAAPLLLWLRRSRRAIPHSTDAASGRLQQPLSTGQSLAGLLLVAALTALMAQEHLNPESWLGQRLAAPNGKLWFAAFSLLLLFVVEPQLKALFKAYLRWRERRNKAP